MPSEPAPAGKPAEMLLRLIEMTSAPDGHLDDEVLALIELGAACASELEAVHKHIAVCPPCRRRVSAALVASAESGAREPTPGLADRGSRPAVLPITRRWAAPPFRLAWAAAVLLAATTLFAIFAVPGRRTLEQLPLAFALVRGQAMGVEGATVPPTIVLDPSGTASIPAGQTFSVRLAQPRDGEAVIVRVTSERWQIAAATRLHAPGTASGEAPDETMNLLHPLTSPPVEADHLVIATDRTDIPLRETVTSLLPAGDAPRPTIDAWKIRLIQALKSTGHRWVSIERFRTVPAEVASTPSRSLPPRP